MQTRGTCTVLGVKAADGGTKLADLAGRPPAHPLVDDPAVPANKRPAIGRGDPASCEVLDQRKGTRVHEASGDTACDLGALEFLLDGDGVPDRDDSCPEVKNLGRDDDPLDPTDPESPTVGDGIDDACDPIRGSAPSAVRSATTTTATASSIGAIAVRTPSIPGKCPSAWWWNAWSMPRLLSAAVLRLPLPREADGGRSRRAAAEGPPALAPLRAQGAAPGAMPLTPTIERSLDRRNEPVLAAGPSHSNVLGGSG
ncbi:MAG: hypothetical protein KIT14_16280 [bacterium]|nr:hypothetical protein [bacterium]